MIDLFIILLFAHLLGDFVFQTGKLVQMKRKIWGQLIHSFIIFSATIILIPTKQGIFLAWIMASTHLIIDLIKIKINRDTSLKLFLIDQLLHLIVIIFLIFTFGMRYELFWFYQSRVEFLKFILILIGLILNTGLANWIIVKFFQNYYPDENFDTGLEKAGKFIGYLERIIIMIMVLTNNIVGIGFLMIAKSILIIGKLTNSKNKKEAEYNILGTLLSFVLSLIFSYSIIYLLNLL